MNSVESTKESAVRARALLDAWTCGDLSALRRELFCAVASERTVAPVVEDERRELLDSIVDTMRSAIGMQAAIPATPTVQTSLYLLKHLVHCQ